MENLLILRRYNRTMREKYKSIGLDYDLIISKYPSIEEYEEVVNAYLSDPFFNELGDYIDKEDYELAKDATKGLFILAQELYIYPLYMALMEVYEDLEDELYKDIRPHYDEMIKVYKNIRGVFCA